MVLGINADDYDKDAIVKFTERIQLKQPILLFGNEVANDYRLKRWPSNVYIDRSGNIADHDFDYANPTTIEQKIQKILRSPAPKQ